MIKINEVILVVISRLREPEETFLRSCSDGEITRNSWRFASTSASDAKIDDWVDNPRFVLINSEVLDEEIIERLKKIGGETNQSFDVWIHKSDCANGILKEQLRDDLIRSFHSFTHYGNTPIERFLEQLADQNGRCKTGVEFDSVLHELLNPQQHMLNTLSMLCQGFLAANGEVSSLPVELASVASERIENIDQSVWWKPVLTENAYTQLESEISAINGDMNCKAQLREEIKSLKKLSRWKLAQVKKVNESLGQLMR